jgi:DNA polymerase III subunit delta
MILFLYGEDTFRSRHKLHEIVTRFKKSDSAGINLVTLDMSVKNFGDFSQAVTAAPFLGNRRLVIAANAVSSARAEVQAELADFLKSGRVPAATTLVFHDSGKVDKRKKLYKLLAKPRQAQEFKLLPEAEVPGWVKTAVARRGGKIEAAAVAKLAAYVGNDLWKLNNEIDKLVLYRAGKIIRSQDVETMVKARLDENVFHLVDAIGEQNLSKSLQLLHEQFEQGENEIRLLGMITYQFRNLAQVVSLVEKNVPEAEIKAQTGLHPFVVRKTMSQARRFSFAKVKKIYDMLVRTDLAMKTSKLDKKTALDLLVTGLCH